MTSTIPVSGTLVTTYIYDNANCLTDRTVSDGRAYTYTWSARGHMLAEWTQGYPDRHAPGNLLAHNCQLGITRDQPGAQFGHDPAIYLALLKTGHRPTCVPVRATWKSWIAAFHFAS